MSVTDVLSLPVKSGPNNSCSADDTAGLHGLGLADLDVESCDVSDRMQSQTGAACLSVSFYLFQTQVGLWERQQALFIVSV